MSVHIILRLYCEYLISNNHKIPIYLYSEQHIESSGTHRILCTENTHTNAFDKNVYVGFHVCVYLYMYAIVLCYITITIHARINAYKSINTHVPRFMGKIVLLLMVDSAMLSYHLYHRRHHSIVVVLEFCTPAALDKRRRTCQSMCACVYLCMSVYESFSTWKMCTLTQIVCWSFGCSILFGRLFIITLKFTETLSQHTYRTHRV